MKKVIFRSFFGFQKKVHPNFWENVDPSKWDYLNHDLIFPTKNFDNYELLHHLGKGGYSTIYKAFDIINEKSVTIKILNHEQLKKIKREIMVLNHIKDKSEYLINILDYGYEPSSQTYFFVN
jgi:serine/threonine protein kinase